MASAVQRELARAGQSETWLAESSGIDPQALQRKLAMQIDFTATELAHIAMALGVPIERVVPPLPPR